MVFHLVTLMLFRRIVVEGIAVCLNGKHRLFADAVDDEEIDFVVVFSFQFIQKAVKVGKEHLVLDDSVLLIFPQRLLFCLFMGYASCIWKNVMVVDGQEFD